MTDKVNQPLNWHTKDNLPLGLISVYLNRLFFALGFCFSKNYMKMCTFKWHQVPMACTKLVLFQSIYLTMDLLFQHFDARRYKLHVLSPFCKMKLCQFPCSNIWKTIITKSKLLSSWLKNVWFKIEIRQVSWDTPNPGKIWLKKVFTTIVDKFCEMFGP